MMQDLQRRSGCISSGFIDPVFIVFIPVWLSYAHHDVLWVFASVAGWFFVCGSRSPFVRMRMVQKGVDRPGEVMPVMLFENVMHAMFWYAVPLLIRLAWRQF